MNARHPLARGVVRALPATALLLFLTQSGCTATLPGVVTKNDANVFASDANVESEAQKCGHHLNSLRRNARNFSWARTALSILAGTTSAVSGFVSATSADDDPGRAETTAIVALVGGVIAVLSQAIPDPSQALDRHRAGESSWAEARRIVVVDGKKPSEAFSLLSACRRNEEYRATPSIEGEPL